PSTGYDDEDDGLHPFNDEEYYEWWYFDAQFDNGYSCVLTWHWRNAFLKPHIPTIQIFTYTPDGKRHIGMAVVKPEECDAKRNKCDVQMGESFARQDGNRYQVKMHAKGVGAELCFQGELPGWKPTSGFVYQDKGVEQGWVIAVPRGHVEGQLYLGDKTIAVKGRGYHDHNWGNRNLYDCFRGWHWGRLFDPKYTLIYALMLPLDNTKPVTPSLYLAKGDKLLLTASEFGFIVQKEEADEVTKKPTARDIVLSGKGRDIQFKCYLKTKRVVEQGKLPQITEWPQYNWRFLADYHAEVKIGNSVDEVSGETIHEFLLLR
ncbi:MAG: carotenoid 1,2-hydratase, partial [Chloroflexi bacterium]|nr:carotenoid 1,2-hydratase [Chloroflexota bacterium]